MKWVSECASNEVFIQDPQLRNFKLCRPTDYYVDPDSSEIIELGTKKYPYKNIALVFIEILNFHSNSNRSISIFLKEFTTSYVMQAKNYIINMTSVSIDSYSVGLNSPSNAIMYGVNK